LSSPLLNQQVLGESTIKNAVNNNIKLGGLTVKQLLQSGGNMYAAMIAFETQNDKLRMSVWMSWGATSIQSLFEKEIKSTFTFEMLEGMVVPASGYVKGNGKVMNVKPVKYQVSISDLEFTSDPSSPNYTPEKESWVRPAFEKLTAQWTLAGANATTTTKKGTTTTKKQATTGNTSSASDTTSGDTQVTETTLGTDVGDTTAGTSTDASASATTATAVDTDQERPEDDGGFPVLPLVLGIIGVLIIGGGAAFFVISQKKSKGV
jgi:hypothetical protein